MITSNRAVDEWLGLFEDPILGNSALDAWPTPAIRSSSRDPATGNVFPHTGPCWGPQGVIDQTTATLTYSKITKLPVA